MTESARSLLLFTTLLLGALACEGQGSGGDAAVVQLASAAGCASVGGEFPSGLDFTLDGSGHLLVMQHQPPTLRRFSIDGEAPIERTPDPAPQLPTVAADCIATAPGDPPAMGIDSDGDGVADGCRSLEAGICFTAGCVPNVGAVVNITKALALVSSSTYESLLFYDPASSTLRALLVANPVATGDFDPADHLLLPPGGTTALRTALSTRACVYAPGATRSDGGAIGSHRLCAPGRPSYLSRFTNHMLVAGDRLLVTTANLLSAGRFFPGTVLVYDWDDSASPITLSPHAERSVLFTSHFNPTGLTFHRNALGHPLALVTMTGPIDSAGRTLGEGGVDVIDLDTLRVVATIPLGAGAPGFGPLAIDVTGRVGLVGSATQRNLYAVDLAALDDAALYAMPDGPPIRLDGSSAGFPDARIFHAGQPLRLPERPDGPPIDDVPTLTYVDLDESGRWAYATDWSHGTLTLVEIDLDGAGPVPLSRAHFFTRDSLYVTAPKSASSLGDGSSPSQVRVRPGRPGVDFDGSDVFYLVNEPDGELCGTLVDP